MSDPPRTEMAARTSATWERSLRSEAWRQKAMWVMRRRREMTAVKPV
jgi:hypothetical protein